MPIIFQIGHSNFACSGCQNLNLSMKSKCLALQKLGLVLPLKDAGVTEMVDTPDPYYVSKIFQKSFIEVNEEGTEVAAVTCVSMYSFCSVVRFL